LFVCPSCVGDFPQIDRPLETIKGLFEIRRLRAVKKEVDSRTEPTSVIRKVEGLSSPCQDRDGRHLQVRVALSQGSR